MPSPRNGTWMSRDQIPRRKKRPRRQLLTCPLLLLGLHGVRGQGANGIYGQCFQHMTAADANQNTFLAQNEFVDFVHRLTYGAVDAPFANLGATLQAVYSSRVEGIELPITGASPTTVASPSQQSFLNSLCADTILGLLEALTIVVDIPKCFLA